MQLKAKASIQIQQPVQVVFDSVANPEHLAQYFIATSTGSLETGKEVTWKFPEFDLEFLISEVKIIDNTSISFVWESESKVTITFEQQIDQSTLVRVTEGEKTMNEQNIKWVIGNTEGWANFLACMKAYLDHGIQLRKGAFDFMRK